MADVTKRDESDPAGPSAQATAPRARPALYQRPWFWIAVVALLALIPIGRTLARAGGDAEPDEAATTRSLLPPFELRNTFGRPVTRETLRGKVWAVNFMFTSCKGVCPKLMKEMVKVDERGKALGEDFLTVTITVDPENDTPGVLSEYATDYRTDAERWFFLTGELSQIERTVIDGFKSMFENREREPGIFEIVHGERIILVDQQSYIVGYFDANDEGIDALMQKAQALLASD